jgi:hypothetical protein
MVSALPPQLSNSVNFNLMVGSDLVLSFYVDKNQYQDLIDIYLKDPKMIVKSSDANSVTFDYLINDVVVKTQTVSNSTDMGKMLIAAYSSDPKFVLVS